MLWLKQMVKDGLHHALCRREANLECAQLKKIATNTTSPARLGLCRSFGRNNTVVSLFPGWCIVFRTSIKAA